MIKIILYFLNIIKCSLTTDANYKFLKQLTDNKVVSNKTFTFNEIKIREIKGKYYVYTKE
ncbi:hypothetical protein IC006_1752 [Sulfuracidifex tepidarius]|uniref:Uncharacterized protein n=1 Tax=Sulfuracidifex tepidarius TaxID=1294262 RepID=A0A510DW29_9CREN|nr:putative integrase [Sulfuracidifex tepidarius]BBG24436.1 hypothetical protein IC006_1752 [Sulfuracidifex tepidarius]BBG27194.1 hypothetical protein IC007_1730 [Sulfuracidifex tepidarius]